MAKENVFNAGMITPENAKQESLIVYRMSVLNAWPTPTVPTLMNNHAILVFVSVHRQNVMEMEKHANQPKDNARVLMNTV